MREILVIRNNGGKACGLQEGTDQLGAAIDQETEDLRKQYQDAKILSGCVSCCGCVFLEGGLARCTLKAIHPQNISNRVASNPHIETAEELLGGTAIFNPEGARITELPQQTITELPLRKVA